VSGDDKHQKMHLSKKPKPKLRFLSQNLPKPTDNGNFGNVTTLTIRDHAFSHFGTISHVTAYYLKVVNVLLSISASRQTTCYLICQLVNDDIKGTLLFQRLVEIKLKQHITKHATTATKLKILPKHQQTENITFVPLCAM